MRFKNAVHVCSGTEAEKIASAKYLYPRPPALKVPSCMQCGAEGIHACSSCNVTYYCSTQCQISGWMKHREVCKRIQHNNAGKNRSKYKIDVGELLSVAMRGGGVKGVLGTILSYL